MYADEQDTFNMPDAAAAAAMASLLSLPLALPRITRSVKAIGIGYKRCVRRISSLLDVIVFYCKTPLSLIVGMSYSMPT